MIRRKEGRGSLPRKKNRWMVFHTGEKRRTGERARNSAGRGSLPEWRPVVRSAHRHCTDPPGRQVSGVHEHRMCGWTMRGLRSGKAHRGHDAIHRGEVRSPHAWRRTEQCKSGGIDDSCRNRACKERVSFRTYKYTVQGVEMQHVLNSSLFSSTL